MLRINETAAQPSLSTVSQVKTDKQVLLEQWQAWAQSAQQALGEQRYIALQRLKFCLQANSETLDLSCLHLTHLPEQWWPLKIKKLDVSLNHLSQLPCHLPPTLHELSAFSNQLTELPEQLPVHLTELAISYNQLESLPASLPDGLITLDSRYNLLKQLPSRLPIYLSILDVGNNQLKALPDQLPPALNCLDVRGNQLTGLPPMLPNSIEVLQAHTNQLKALPTQLPLSLRHLNVGCNQLTQLPATLPASLQNLYVCKNKLRWLPSTLPHLLRRLTVDNNQLRGLPDPLPSGLCHLSMSNNELHQLPDQLPTGLLTLEANNTQLSGLPVMLPDSLQQLSVDHNQLIQLPASLPRSLSILSARHNQITQLPDRLPASLQLNISGNPVDYYESRHLLVAEIAKWITDLAPWQRMQPHKGLSSFSLFLRRLRSVASHNRLLKERVIGLLAYLAKAENSGLRERLLLMADDAISSCQDRLFYYFNQMYVAMLEDQLTSGQTGIQGLFSVNRSLYRLQILNQLAAEQVMARQQRSPGFNEEIEIYLAYQCLLREPLALPIYTQLEHIEIAQVTEVDIKLAIAHVLKQEQRHFIRYLVTESSSWQHRLEQWNRSQVQADNEAYLAAIEGEAFNQQIDAQLRQHGIAADDTEARVVMVKEQADALRYQQRYQLSYAFLKEQQALDLIDDFMHPLMTVNDDGSTVFQL